MEDMTCVAMISPPIAARPSASTGCSTSSKTPSRAEQDNYPPFDIEKLGDDSYRITLAVAGFRRDEIEIVAHQNMLTISGRRAEERGRDGNFLHMGIANRAFERRFELADFVRVTGAELSDGLLSIELAREIPEAMKPRKIDDRRRRAGDASRRRADEERAEESQAA